MKIGNIKLANPVIAAPMAGVSDKAFRILAKEAGVGLVYTEMVSDMALIYNNQKTKTIMNLENESEPVCVQIFGSKPESMAQGAKLIEEAGAHLIDINMGCPAPKIVKNNEGSALMKDLDCAERIVKAVVRAVKIPVTVKMRKGWDDQSVNAVELAQRVEAQGAAAVTVHGRTRSQFYSGQADWEIIAKVKNMVKIPVTGNGDIWQPQDAKRMMDETGCDAVMIGRGAQGNPWLFKRTVHYLETGELLPGPDGSEKLRTAIRHFELLYEDKGERVAVREMRKHAAWYIKGLRDATNVREEINRATTRDEVIRILTEYLSIL